MKIALLGNPGVGKSLIFNQLTGLGVEVNKYPGSTINLERGNVCYKNEKTELIDLPGVYSLDGNSEEEVLVRRFLLNEGADIIIAVLDATKLERNLYLLVQVAEYPQPMIAVVNMIDEAEREGLFVDTSNLSEIIGIEVLPTEAPCGKNIDRIIPLALFSARQSSLHIPYDHHVEAATKTLEKTMGTPRYKNLLALQECGDDLALRDAAQSISREIEQRHRMSVGQIIATNRHNFARNVAAEVVKKSPEKRQFDLDRILTRAFPGIPLLCLILFSLLLAVFVIGSWMETLIVQTFTLFIITPFMALGLPPFFERIGFSVLVALEAGLGIAFPFVFTFYVGLSLIEDTGYMTRAAFLADRAMHRLGLHGEAIIPMVIGFGCTVPALLSLRILKTRREQTIAAFLITQVPLLCTHGRYRGHCRGICRHFLGNFHLPYRICLDRHHRNWHLPYDARRPVRYDRRDGAIKKATGTVCHQEVLATDQGVPLYCHATFDRDEHRARSVPVLRVDRCIPAAGCPYHRLTARSARLCIHRALIWDLSKRTRVRDPRGTCRHR